MNPQKDACLLYRTIVEAAKEMEKDEALELLLAYADYALGDTDEIKTENKYVKLILKQVVPSLKAADNRYQAAVENGNKGKDYGKNGGGVGRPRKGESQEDYQKRVEEWKKSKNPQNNPQKVDNPVLTTNIPEKPTNNPTITPDNNPVFEKTPSQPIQNPQKNPQDVDVEVDVEEDVYVDNEIDKEEEKIGNTLGKEICKKVTTNTDTLNTLNITENNIIDKEEDMLVNPVIEKETMFTDEERNLVGNIETKNPCTQDELKSIYKDNFIELLRKHPNYNYSLLMTGEKELFYVYYKDTLDDMVIKLRNESQRGITKDDTLKTLYYYLSSNNSA